jgi:hypothetical protein
VEHIIL